MENKKQPEKRIIVGGISATIWNNKKIVNDEIKEHRTITIERSYKDQNGNWQTSSKYNLNDLPKVLLVASKAYEYISLKIE